MSHSLALRLITDGRHLPGRAAPAPITLEQMKAGRGVIYALGLSPVDGNRLWAGTDDGMRAINEGPERASVMPTIAESTITAGTVTFPATRSPTRITGQASWMP